MAFVRCYTGCYANRNPLIALAHGKWPKVLISAIHHQRRDFINMQDDARGAFRWQFVSAKGGVRKR
jgi:hypothetical protein